MLIIYLLFPPLKYINFINATQFDRQKLKLIIQYIRDSCLI